ncbi:hypothetical protein KSS87_010634 [Heliosperma pusillum]|nr:hypothetical protein KSS87_010634 [Heliosperma pusillum]
MDYSYLVYSLIFIVSYILNKKILHKYQHLPPTPFPTIPILGHLHLLTNPNSIHRTFANLASKYGPIIHLQFGSRPILLVSSTSAAIDCLHRNDVTFASRPQLTSGRILGYNFTSLIWAPYGPLWRAHRKIASTEILSPHRLNLFRHIRGDEVKLLLRRLYDVQGARVEIKSTLFELSNNVMMRMIAGKRCYDTPSHSTDSLRNHEKGFNNEGERFRVLMKELIDTGPVSSAADFFPVMKYFGKSSREKLYERLFGKMDRFFQDLLDEKRREMEEQRDADVESRQKTKTLIEVLLDLHKSDPAYFTDTVIKGLVQDLLLAGSETTASTMEWALSLLLNHPETLKKAQNEIDEYVGNNRLLEEGDINHLPFLRCIINETLRMYPAAALLPPHENSSECIVGGLRVKKHSMLIVNIWAIHNDPSVWDEPSKFKPERFENVKSESLECVFMPFGSGRRSCPGEHLALKVIGIALGSLLQCFDWERVGTDLVDMQEFVGVTMSKVCPLEAKCKPRGAMIHFISSISNNKTDNIIAKF